MWNAVEQTKFSNISATPATFTLRGGAYGVTVHATWGGGSVKLQRQAADDSTYISVSSATDFTADGYASVNLPSGTYQLTVATATGIYVDVTSIVTSL